VSAVLPKNARRISTRLFSFLDSESLEPRQAREALFRDGNSYILYMCDGASHAAREERVISFGLREALLWLNENPAEEQTLRDRRFGPTSDISLK
jgi:hypothetical protein